MMQTWHFFHSGTLQYWFQSSLKSNNFVDDKKKYGYKQYWCKPQRVTTAYSKEQIFINFGFSVKVLIVGTSCSRDLEAGRSGVY